MSDRRDLLVRRAGEVWGLTMVAAAVYLVSLGRFPPSGDDSGFLVWAAFVALGTAFTGAWVMGRLRSWLVPLYLVMSPATGFVTAYVVALFTYGSGAEDGTVWRGIGGGLLGAVSLIAAMVLHLVRRLLTRDFLPAGQV